MARPRGSPTGRDLTCCGMAVAVAWLWLGCGTELYKSFTGALQELYRYRNAHELYKSVTGALQEIYKSPNQKAYKHKECKGK